AEPLPEQPARHGLAERIAAGGRHGLRPLHDALAPAGAQPLRRPPLGSPAAPLGRRARLQRSVDRRAPHGALGASPVPCSPGGPGPLADRAHTPRPRRVPPALPPPSRPRPPGPHATPPRAATAQLRPGG